MWVGGQRVSDQEGPGTVHGPLGRELVTPLTVSKVEHALYNKGVCHLERKHICTNDEK